MSQVSATLVNQMLASKLDDPAHRAKVAQMTGDYIRDHLRESAFCRNIVPPKQVTRDECQVSTEHDTIMKIVEIEPNSKAMTVDFRGAPTARIISGKRVGISFYTITSERFEKTEQELLAYTIPITKIIEDHTDKDIEEIEDREFTLHAEACVQAVQKELNGGVATKFSRTNIGSAVSASVVKGSLALEPGGADSFVVRPIQRKDFVELKKLLSGNRLTAMCILMSEPDMDDINQWTSEDIGAQLQSETTKEGYKSSTVLGLKIIRTIKGNILRQGNVYIFTDPDFFGRFYVLNNTKFYIDKEVNLIWWQAWEDIGMGFPNISAVRKLELYSASVTPGATDTGYADRLPVAEEDIEVENNFLDAGLMFPKIKQY